MQVAELRLSLLLAGFRPWLDRYENPTLEGMVQAR